MSSPVTDADMRLICELNELWCLLGSKSRQRRLCFAYATKTGSLLACTFGRRTDETCRALLLLLTPFNIGMITRDDRGSDAREILKNMPLTGNIFTQRIERNNLALRTRMTWLACKTICFSHSVELHKKVIGAFIGKNMFY